MKYQDQVKIYIQTHKPDGLVTRLKSQIPIWDDIQLNTQNIGAKNNSERIYAYSQGITSPPLCKCGDKLNFVSVTMGYREFCSRTCSYAKEAATLRRVQVLKSKGGVGLANPAAKVKAAQTLQAKHGDSVTNPGQIKSHKENMLVNNPMFSESVREKLSLTVTQRYGANRTNPSHIMMSDEQCALLYSKDNFSEFVRGKSCIQVSTETGLNYTTILNAAKKYNLLDSMVYNHRSEMEHDLKQWLTSQNIPYKHDDRTLLANRREIDFLFSDCQFGIELNGLPTHSEVEGKKDSRYHYDKFKECERKGITLLQFWPDEYWEKKSIVRSKILYLCNRIDQRIAGRKCDVRVLDDTVQERQFLDLNHIQGFASYRQHSLGAWYEDRLIGVMNFAQNHSRMELVRYATDINHCCVGLFSKMFKKSLSAFDLSGTIVSMSDNRVSNGKMYASAGWTHLRNVAPNYCYTKNQYTREDKQHYRKEKLISKFNLSKEYVGSKTEWEIMREFGYDRLWDAGKKVWTITV